MKTWVIITQCRDGLYENEVKAKTVEEAYKEAEKFGGHALCEKWELLSQGLGVVIDEPKRQQPKRLSHLPEKTWKQPASNVETVEDTPVRAIDQLPRRAYKQAEEKRELPSYSFSFLIYDVLIFAIGAAYIGAANYLLFDKLEALIPGAATFAEWLIVFPVIVLPVAVFFASGLPVVVSALALILLACKVIL